MAACRLIIELEEPSKTRVGGEPVSGVILVDTEKETKCNELVVHAGWHTHGVGNIDQGEAERKTLFEGVWQPGKQYRYPFTLVTATWPPTYYGHDLNVDHFVEAEAKIPWATNAKTSSIFSVVAQKSPEDLKPVDNRSSSMGWFARTILAVIGIALLLGLLSIAVVLVPVVAIGFAVYWFFFKLMPRRITGNVSLTVEPNRVTAGQSIRGNCSFTPKRNSTINGISWTIKSVETCVSGSGSNRKTHTHEVLTKTERLLDATELVAGQTYAFDFGYEIPPFSPPSLTFTDNRVEWSSELRIDIPRWPDWAKKIPFVVNVKPANAIASSDIDADHPSEASEDDDPWLTEVIQQVMQSKDDPERLEVVLEAVTDQKFTMVVDVQGKVAEPYEADVDDEGNWVAAHDPRRNVRMVLFVPESLPVDRIAWVRKYQCQATIIGHEANADRVIMRLSDEFPTPPEP